MGWRDKDKKKIKFFLFFCWIWTSFQWTAQPIHSLSSSQRQKQSILRGWAWKASGELGCSLRCEWERGGQFFFSLGGLRAAASRRQQAQREDELAPKRESSNSIQLHFHQLLKSKEQLIEKWNWIWWVGWFVSELSAMERQASWRNEMNSTWRQWNEGSERGWAPAAIERRAVGVALFFCGLRAASSPHCSAKEETSRNKPNHPT